MQQAIDFNHDLQATDFAITDSLFRAFTQFVASDPNLKHLSSLAQANRSFVGLQMRFNIVTAAHGRVMADRVFVTGDDQQVARAVELVPRARFGYVARKDPTLNLVSATPCCISCAL